MISVIQRIKQFNARLLPDMLQLKYQAMAQDPFAFFRGTCHLFYADLAAAADLPPSPLAWICGDLHLENFGSYKGDDREVYFDLNDFDEGMLAPLHWELTRMLTSLYVALNLLGFKTKEIDQLAFFYVENYADNLKTGKAHYIDPRTAQGVTHIFLNKAKDKTEADLIRKKATTEKTGAALKIDNRSHFKLEGQLRKELKKHVNQQLRATGSWISNYRVQDVVFRVAGIGSMGLKRYVFLLRHRVKANTFLLTELKQTRPSSLVPYNKTKQPAWTSEAQRVNSIRYRMQQVSPVIIGETLFKNNNFIFQELQPYANKIKYGLLTNGMTDLKQVLRDMALLTASAQLRSSGIQGSAINDQLTAFASDRNWQKPLITYAKQYAKRVQSDYYTYISAYKKTAVAAKHPSNSNDKAK